MIDAYVFLFSLKNLADLRGLIPTLCSEGGWVSGFFHISKTHTVPFKDLCRKLEKANRKNIAFGKNLTQQLRNLT